jgi:hypothetical protein
MSGQQNTHWRFTYGTKLDYGHQSLGEAKYVLHLKWNGVFRTPHFEDPKQIRTPILADGIEEGYIEKVPPEFDFFVERIEAMGAEYKEFANYGIFKAMNANRESCLEHTQVSKLIMEKIAEYMIDEVEELHVFSVPKENIWEELTKLQLNRSNLQFNFIEEVVQVVLEVRSLLYLY